MSTTKDEIKKWLKKTNRDRYWLATQCGVDKRTVDDWLSTSRTVPAKALLTIQQLMKQDEEEPKMTTSHYQRMNGMVFVPLMISDELFEKVAKAAEMENLPIEEYIRQTAIADTKNETAEFEQMLYPQMAEKETPYGGPSTPLEPPIIKTEDIVHGSHQAKHAARKKTPPIANFPLYTHTETPPAKKTGLHTLELAGNIAAGNLMEGDTEPRKLKLPTAYPEGSYALRVSGKSMEPKIMDGSVIVIKPWTYPTPPKNGSIVVYYDERGVTLKKIAKRGDKNVLASINPAFPELEPMEGGSISAIYIGTLEDIA